MVSDADRCDLPRTHNIDPGVTETSPVSFMTASRDSITRRLETVGRVFPHVLAKVIDPQDENNIVQRGTRGDLCVSGWLLQRGYSKNRQKTSAAMVRDTADRVWMRTGDEASIDNEGYCRITGRIKDIIIRGMYKCVSSQLHIPGLDQHHVTRLQ